MLVVVNMVLRFRCYSTADMFFHCCASHVRFSLGTIYHLLMLLALLSPILQQRTRSTFFFCVLSGRGLALRFFLQENTRERSSFSSSPRHLITEYHKRMLLKWASKEPSSVRVSRLREPVEPGVPETRHSKSRGSPGTNPGRLSEKLPGSRYRVLVPGRNPHKDQAV